MFAEAKEAAAREIAASKAPVSFADAAEVARVLAAKSDYDVLKVGEGAVQQGRQHSRAPNRRFCYCRPSLATLVLLHCLSGESSAAPLFEGTGGGTLLSDGGACRVWGLFPTSVGQ